jgi:hypothetical protein
VPVGEFRALLNRAPGSAAAAAAGDAPGYVFLSLDETKELCHRLHMAGVIRYVPNHAAVDPTRWFVSRPPADLFPEDQLVWDDGVPRLAAEDPVEPHQRASYPDARWRLPAVRDMATYAELARAPPSAKRVRDAHRTRQLAGAPHMMPCDAAAAAGDIRALSDAEVLHTWAEYEEYRRGRREQARMVQPEDPRWAGFDFRAALLRVRAIKVAEHEARVAELCRAAEDEGKRSSRQKKGTAAAQAPPLGPAPPFTQAGVARALRAVLPPSQAAQAFSLSAAPQWARATLDEKYREIVRVEIIKEAMRNRNPVAWGGYRRALPARSFAGRGDAAATLGAKGAGDVVVVSADAPLRGENIWSWTLVPKPAVSPPAASTTPGSDTATGPGAPPTTTTRFGKPRKTYFSLSRWPLAYQSPVTRALTEQAGAGPARAAAVEKRRQDRRADMYAAATLESLAPVRPLATLRGRYSATGRMGAVPVFSAGDTASQERWIVGRATAVAWGGEFEERKTNSFFHGERGGAFLCATLTRRQCRAQDPQAQDRARGADAPRHGPPVSVAERAAGHQAQARSLGARLQRRRRQHHQDAPP